jgi:hypothetical protein
MNIIRLSNCTLILIRMHYSYELEFAFQFPNILASSSWFWRARARERERRCCSVGVGTRVGALRNIRRDVVNKEAVERSLGCLHLAVDREGGRERGEEAGGSVRFRNYLFAGLIRWED